MDIPGSEEVQAKIMAALYAGRKIEAVKLCREATGLGLKESKDLIDAVEDDLRAKNPERFTHAKGASGCSASAMLMLAGLATGVAILLSR